MTIYKIPSHSGSCDIRGAVYELAADPGGSYSSADTSQTFIIDVSAEGHKAIKLKFDQFDVWDYATTSDRTEYDFLDIYTDDTPTNLNFYARFGGPTLNEGNLVGNTYCIPTETGKLLLCWNIDASTSGGTGFRIEWTGSSGCCGESASPTPTKESPSTYESQLPLTCAAVQTFKCTQYPQYLTNESPGGYWTSDVTNDPGVKQYPGNVVVANTSSQSRVKGGPVIVRNVFAQRNYDYEGNAVLPFAFAGKGPFTIRQRSEAYKASISTTIPTSSQVNGSEST